VTKGKENKIMPGNKRYRAQAQKSLHVSKYIIGISCKENDILKRRNNRGVFLSLFLRQP
jgi:hypothetical protein